MQEISYVCDQIFNNFFSKEYSLVFSEDKDLIEISTATSPSTVRIPPIFFKYANNNWLTIHNEHFFKPTHWKINDGPFKHTFPFDDTYIYFGHAYCDILDNSDLNLGFDLFGAIFFFLSSYEECLIEDRDIHGRFLASHSISRSIDQIGLPLVNHYVEILRVMLSSLDRSLIDPPKRQFSLKVSCDVDYPIELARQSLLITLYHVVRQIRQRDVKTAWRYCLNYIQHFTSNVSNDLNSSSIFFICKELEKRALRGLFYFIPEKTSSMDLSFDRKHSYFLHQAQLVFNRGHEIGVHPGYNTSKSQKDFSSTIGTFFENFPINLDEPHRVQNRFHYLRFDPTIDLSVLQAQTHIEFVDSSMCYPDAIGFRNGICWSFDMYDLHNREPAGIIQRPLLAMDVSMFAPNYMDLAEDEALKSLKKLSSHIQQFQGEFMILFHNNQLNNNRRRAMFTDFLDFNLGIES